MTAIRRTITPVPIPTPITTPLSELLPSEGGVTAVEVGDFVAECGGGGGAWTAGTPGALCLGGEGEAVLPAGVAGVP